MVGNRLIIAIFLSLYSIALYGDIKLSVRDMYGKATSQVAVGVPFLLDAQMQVENGAMRYPLIENIDAFNAHRAGFQLNTINGKSRATYTYQLRIDQVGTYKIGPARLSTDQGVEESNVVSLEVVEHVIIKSKKNTAPFLRLSINKEHVFVGEKVVCILRLYYQDIDKTIRAVGNPEIPVLDNGHVGTINKPTQGITQENGVQYNYVEWVWDFFPTKEGKITFPAHVVDYQKERSAHHNRMGMLFSFMSKQIKQERLYSNALTLTVDSLPPTNLHVSAVGIIKKFCAQLVPSVAKKGEGMVLTLRVEGDVDFALLDIHKLNNMPPLLKWYESKQQVVDNTKIFEFIIQGLEVGDWHIPAQELTYFDVVSKKYKTLKSDAVALTIIESGVAASDQKQEKIIEDTPSNTPPLLMLDDADELHEHEECALQWKWFIGIVCSIAMLWIFFLIFILVRKHWYKNKKRTAFLRARKQLKVAQKQRDSSVIYTIIMHAIGDRCGIAYEELSCQCIIDMLNKNSYTSDKIDAWQLFFEQIQAEAFYTKKYSEIIFDNALYWLAVLEKVL
jgi:hypothetical protein